jgi:hypothetical protein
MNSPRAGAPRAVVLGTVATVTALAALTACKSDRASPPAPPPPPPVVIDAAAVNALLPAALRDHLVFERRELVTDRGGHKATYSLAAPSGWAQTSKLFAHLRPAGSAAQVPRFEVGDNCDGPCTAKPWEPIVDRVHFAPLAKGKLIKDDHVAGRRSMIAELAGDGGSVTHVVVAWWNDRERSYHLCSAQLDEALRAAAPAFDKACQAVVISGED